MERDRGGREPMKTALWVVIKATEWYHMFGQALGLHTESYWIPDLHYTLKNETLSVAGIK